MTFKIIATTDHKFIGEIIHRDTNNLFKIGDVIEYKDVVFPIEEIKFNGGVVTLSCSNYVVNMKVI